MTRSFVALSRVAALSITLTLLAAPLASAQSPEAAPATAVQVNTALLNAAAFARLIQVPETNPRQVLVVTGPLRLDLLRQATAEMARQTQPAAVKAPQQKSGASGHKWAIIVPIIIGGAILATWGVMTVISCNTGC